MNVQSTPDDLAGACGTVARALLGDPNPLHSTKTEWRYGNNGSLSIDLEKGTFYDHENGQGGGTLDLIVRERGGSKAEAAKWVEELTGKQSHPAPKPKIVATYRYEDENGGHLFDVVRLEPKTFRQRAPNGDWTVKGIRKVLYRLPELVAAPAGETIYLVEGEKDAQALVGRGFHATTNPGGAGKWNDDYNDALKGKSVVIVPDNDDAGRDHAEKVRASLAKSGIRCALLELDGLPPKGDVADWLAMGGSSESLDALAAKALLAAGQDAPFFKRGSELHGKPVPAREWLVQDLIPMNTVTLLGGDGGTGKSLLSLQLACAVALARKWISLPARSGRALFMSAEDDLDEIHRRLNDITAAENVRLADLDNLVIASLAGEDALLAAISPQKGALQPSPLYWQLEQMMIRERPAVLVLDTLADLFPGNENDRAQARQFIGLLRGLAIRHQCAVVLLAHPSLSGLNSGKGTSGSTGWNNSVRSRLYLDRVLIEDQEQDPDARILHTMKTNYGRTGGQIGLTWSNGVFLAKPEETGLDRMAQNAKAERVFLKLLDEFNAEGRRVRHTTGNGFAPDAFARSGRAEGLTKPALRSAMEGLFSRGLISVAEEGPPSRRVKFLQSTPR